MTETERFLRFVGAGGAAAAVNLLARYGFDIVTSYEAAILLAYLCGMATAYLLNRRFVFEPTSLSARESVLRFSAVNLLAAAQVLIVSVGLADHVFPAIGFSWRAHDVAHAVGVASPVVTSYLLHKRFSFAAKPSEPRAVENRRRRRADGEHHIAPE